jgi:hypothetical protein
MRDIEDDLEQVKPTTASVLLCLRGDLLGELDLINDDLDQYDGWEPSSLSDVDPRTGLQARKAELEAQMRAESKPYRFETIGDEAWSDLLAAHPPREGKADREDFDPKTFPTALLAASAVEPTMTIEQAKRLFSRLALPQRNSLFGTAYSANMRGVEVPFLPPSSDAAPANARKSKPRVRGASRAASSSAE